MEFIEPYNVVDIFIYNCGSKFNIDIVQKYIQQYSGSIIFANGDECIVYEYLNGRFIKKKSITACLQKRQKKGGQSALRISRLAEETRHTYITRIIDCLNTITSKNNYLFGSTEITSMIMDKKSLLIKLYNSGFLNFNSITINDTQRWLNYINNDINEYDNNYKKIVLYLDTNIDMLSFDILEKDNMDYYLGKDSNIPFPSFTNEYHSRLSIFEYIGVKYFSSIDIYEYY
jgi:hypothetical protein